MTELYGDNDNTEGPLDVHETYASFRELILRGS